MKCLRSVRIETPLLNVANHPDDLLRGLTVLINSPANGIGVAEVFPREDFIDHDNWL